FTLISAIPIQALQPAEPIYKSYTYDFWNEPVPSPKPFVPQEIIEGEDLEIGDFSEPRDLHVRNEQIYVLDSGNKRIVVMDENFELVREISEFENDGESDTFGNARGLFVTENGDIYVTDRDEGRIIILDESGELLDIIGPPDADEFEFTEDFRYRPEKVGVSPGGRIYVVAAGVYDGILQFDNEGRFEGFIGAPEVRPSMADYFWRTVGTEAQRERMALFLPIVHNNLTVGEDGFIYATVTGGQVSELEKIRKLNPGGEDRLRRLGFYPPVGDIQPADMTEDEFNATVFSDLTTTNYGIYTALDRTRGRVFTYDDQGNLLHVFGTSGSQKGAFQTPVAISYFGDRLLVLDNKKNNITLFEPTEYNQNIVGAIANYNEGRYEKSKELWEKVLRANSNNDMAYSGMGRAFLRNNRYQEAMKHFRLGQNREDYSQAFGYYRMEKIRENFSGILIIAIILIILGMIGLKIARKYSLYNTFRKNDKVNHTLTKIRKNRTGNYLIGFLEDLKYSFHIIFHPFSGFWDMKNERNIGLLAPTFLVLMVTFVYILMRQYTGFVFNERNLADLNVIQEFISIVVPYLLWCGVNWALTTLMEGKGTFREISTATAYALVPIILINLPITIISNYLLLEEANFYYFFIFLGIFWSGCLFFFGTMTIHDYDVLKNTFTTVLIIIGITITLFIGLVFFDLINQISGFISDIYYELVFRI
ncbi:MAG: YIP1 family protein, partial [Bacillota bacterium]